MRPISAWSECAPSGPHQNANSSLQFFGEPLARLQLPFCGPRIDASDSSRRHQLSTIAGIAVRIAAMRDASSAARRWPLPSNAPVPIRAAVTKRCM